MDAPQEQLAIQAPPARLAIEAGYSTDLVPLTYSRQAWNETVRALKPDFQPLAYHNSLLTAEQTQAINDHYDMRLYFGVHGFGLRTKPEGMLHSEALPTQREYRAVWEVVNELEEGDTLLVEGAGFMQHPPDPTTMAQITQLAAALKQFEQAEPTNFFELTTFDTIRRVGQFVLDRVVTGKIHQSLTYQTEAEIGKEGYLFSAWNYAVALALSKGVRVRYADSDYFDELTSIERTGKTPEQQMMSSDPVDRLHFLQDVKQRNYKARNGAKDFALDNLPPEGTPKPKGRKPVLAVLYGGFHEEHMVEAFSDLHLQFTVHNLESSTADERALEHLHRDILPLLNEMMRLMWLMSMPLPEDGDTLSPPDASNQHATAQQDQVLVGR